jgi:hypothetical protein
MPTAFGLEQMELAIRPKPRGEPVNPHVRPAVPEPKVDFDAMRRLVLAGDVPEASGGDRQRDSGRHGGER